RLPAEPLDEAGVGGQRREEHLDRHGAVEEEVTCEVDLGHAAAPEPPVELAPAVEDHLVLLRHAVPRLREGGCRPRSRGARRPPVHPRPSRRRRHPGRHPSPSGASTWRITAAAIGAATWPPVCSLAPGWPSTTTATATCGVSPSGPAKPMIHACELGGSVPSCAV